jgi:phosphoglycerate kinase
VTDYLPTVAGYLIEKEIEYLGNALENPERPFVAILGGAKISGKIEAISSLLEKADQILIGGGIANTFFKAKGYSLGDSLVEDDALDIAEALLEKGGDVLHLPVDVVIADEFDADAESKTMDVGDVPDGWQILDLGPKTVEIYADIVAQAKTVAWNGPLGVFEFEKFAQGTFGVAQAVADSPAVSIIGGGESAAAIRKSGLTEKVSHVSTGGGASLQMLEGKKLPGLAAVEDL